VTQYLTCFGPLFFQDLSDCELEKLAINGLSVNFYAVFSSILEFQVKISDQNKRLKPSGFIHQLSFSSHYFLDPPFFSYSERKPNKQKTQKTFRL
jgi:hypothetical protein